jgi:hypothetical protein
MEQNAKSDGQPLGFGQMAAIKGIGGRLQESDLFHKMRP